MRATSTKIHFIKVVIIFVSILDAADTEESDPYILKWDSDDHFSETSQSDVSDTDFQRIENYANALIVEEKSNEPSLSIDHKATYSNNISVKVERNRYEILLLIFSFYTKHTLTDLGLEDLLRLVNTIFGSEILPTTKYMFKKIFENTEITLSKHMFCKFCLSSMSSATTIESDEIEGEGLAFKCPACSASQEKGPDNTFVTLSIKEQLKQIVLRNSDSIFNNQQKFDENSGCIADITQGETYQRLMDEKVIIPQKTLTLTINTDGAQPFKSKGKSLWILQGIVNELDLHVRFKSRNKFFGGFWYSEKSAEMGLFLKPFVDEMRELSAAGFILAFKGKIIHINVILLVCCCDSPAKSKVLSQIQHNGYYSCPYCTEKGITLDGGNVVKYPFQKSINIRTDCFVREQMLKKALAPDDPNTKNFSGYHGISALYLLPHFDLSKAPVIDYMHHLAGVVKQLFQLILSRVDKDKAMEIDKRLIQITTNSEFSRRTRSLTESAHFKSNEWIDLLLYYGPAILDEIVANKILQHLSLLSSASFKLLKVVSSEEIEHSKIALEVFVKEYNEEYGTINMTSIVHQLFHMAEQVKLFGPMCLYSGFTFEDENGRLMKLIRNPKSILSQIVDRLNLRNTLNNPSILCDLDESVIDFCSDIRRKNKKPKNMIELMIVGRKVQINLCSQSVLTFSDKDISNIFSETDILLKSFTAYTKCKKIIIDDIVYKSQDRICKKTNDSYVELMNGLFGEIIHIVLDSVKVYFIVDILVPTLATSLKYKLLPEHVTKFELNNRARKQILGLCDVKGKCVAMKTKKYVYLSPRPNVHKID